MKNEKNQDLNLIFVKVFNQVLSWEEQSFFKSGNKDITLRELHVIEAVCFLQKSGQNRMSEIAAFLSITPGSLTTSVNGLVKKGYLLRQSDPNDRRVVLIVPTRIAVAANDEHQRLHTEMIDEALRVIGIENKDVLIESLEKLSLMFAENKSIRK